MAERRTIAVVGAGFGGLGLALKLKAAGIHDFVVIDRNRDVGGTWCENVYPGAACDVESHLYCYSFLPQPAWTRRFAGQAEIQAYLARCAEEGELLPHLRLGTQVIGAAFDEGEACWRLALSDGDHVEARILVAACGQLNTPTSPAIPGLEDFAGPCLHSARWDPAFDPAGKTVAVIGTGASAIQIVPALADAAARVVLFQRSGAWVLPKGDRAYTARERRLAGRLPVITRARRAALAARNEARGLAFVRYPWMLSAMAWRSRGILARQVKDPAKRATLRPTYRLGCKRVLLSDTWFSTLNRDDVEVVRDPIARIAPHGVVTADGRTVTVDALVLATGFDVANPLASLDVVGPSGLSLNEAWRDGPRAYKGMSVEGFPNLFLLYGPHTNLGHDSIVSMLEAQADYVVAGVRRLLAPGVRTLSVRPQAAAAFDRLVTARMARTIWSASCTSWYKRADGRVSANWPGLVSGFRRLARRFAVEDYVEETVPARRLDGAGARAPSPTEVTSLGA